jgi:ABC-type glycerol-3-phosphate transport system substrate-binding protein
MSRHQVLGISMLLAGLLLAGCGGASSEIGSPSVPATESALDAVREPIELVILHTNDNWGETEPCG